MTHHKRHKTIDSRHHTKDQRPKKKESSTQYPVKKTQDSAPRTQSPVSRNPELLPIKVVVFDCDGVIFDSKEANVSYYNHVLAHFGRPPMNEDDVEYVHVSTIDEAIQRLFCDDPRISEALAYSKQIDFGPFIRMTRIEPHLRDLLSELRPRYRTAIATNRGEDLEASLRAFELEEAFDLIVSALDVRHPKPHPESLQTVIQTFGVRPEEVLYIGDSEVDGKTARGAGVVFVAYKNKHIEADYHIQDLIEVLKYLKIHKP